MASTKEKALNPTYVSQGAKLRSIRSELGIAPSYLALIFGRTEKNIFDYEEGRRRPIMDYMMLMANLGHYELLSIMDPEQKLCHSNIFYPNPEDREFYDDFSKIKVKVRSDIKKLVKTLAMEATRNDK